MNFNMIEAVLFLDVIRYHFIKIPVGRARYVHDFFARFHFWVDF